MAYNRNSPFSILPTTAGLRHSPFTKIVVATDSLKGSLSSVRACAALARGISRVLPQAQIIQVPLADGGEGTVEALCSVLSGELVTRTVCGPLGDPVDAAFGWVPDQGLAVIEMAAAAGLPLVPPERRNPLLTTTYGVGELIRASLDLGASEILLGIGGSATNDGGAGMAQALGARLLDARGQPIGRGGGALADLASIDMSEMDPRVRRTCFLVASDVRNPLCGAQGTSAVYGPQKGATPKMVQVLDANLRRFAEILRCDLGKDVLDAPGAGAAGGLGAGALAFLGAAIRPGIEVVLEAVGFEERIRGADLVITGEGAIDAQTVHGKAPVGVARAAKKLGIPVIAVAGTLGEGYEAVYGAGIDAVYCILDRPMSLEEAMARAEELLESAAARLGRLVQLGTRS